MGSELVRLSPAMVRAIGIFDAPGFLRGRQRSAAFKARLKQAIEHVLRRYTTWDVEFPLCLRQTAEILRMTKRQFEGVLDVIVSGGLIDAVRAEAIRRVHQGTKSPTPGSTGAWYAPSLFRLGAAFRDLFPDLKVTGTEIAASHPGSHSGTGTVSKGRDIGVNGGESFLAEDGTSLAVCPALTPVIEDDGENEDGAGAINEGLEDALEGYRRTVVPSAMPDRRGRPKAPLDVPDDVFEAALKARLDLNHRPTFKLSPEAEAWMRKK